jgi:3-oxoacyl-[acyl-carrier-protein] synthase-3
VKVIGVGSFIPENVVRNEAVESRLGLDPGWIRKRTGILQRPIALPNEATSDLAFYAARQALEESHLDPNGIGLLLLATSTPDHPLPPTAPLVAHRLGLERAGAVDLAGACAGFLYGMILANSYGQQMGQSVLVVGANVLSRRVNERDPATVGIFSDGAGAVVMVPTERPHLLGSYVAADGSSYDAISVRAGGTREPLTHGGLEQGRHLMSMVDGPAVFKQAVHAMASAGKEAMKRAGVGPEQIDWWIPHQANSRITESTGDLLRIPSARVISVVEQYGNSSAATIPTALAYAVRAGRIRAGDLLLLTAVGAGMISAGVVLRW